jgi:hypothetical protein
VDWCALWPLSDLFAERLLGWPETPDVAQNGRLHDLGDNRPQFPVDFVANPLTEPVSVSRFVESFRLCLQ